MDKKDRQLLKVVDVEGLYKDPQTQSVVNLNHKQYELHKKNKQLAKNRMLEEQAKTSRLNNLERDVADLKEGIQKILEILSHGS